MKKQFLFLVMIFLTALCYGQKDTVRVVLLVCDTTAHISKQGKQIIERNGDDFNLKLIPDTSYNNQVYWQYGYSVIDYRMSANSLLPKWPEPTIYLDDKKQTLPKNNMVWISIRLN